MKKFFIFLTLILFAIGLHFKCGGGGSSSNNNGNNGGGGTILYANTIINDANGEIGKGLAVEIYYIWIYSSKGYIYGLTWAGKSYSGFIHYSGSNCTGTPYYGLGAINNAINGKAVFYSSYLDKLYIPKTINADGTPYFDNINKVTVNSYDSVGIPYNSTQTIYGIELVETDKATVGIPTTITPPLTISFK